MSYDRVKEIWEGTGTGTVTLSGSAPLGFRSLAGAVPNGGQFDYAIVDQSGAQWEVGTGTYSSAGSTLSREKVYAGSAGSSKVDFAAGTKHLFGTVPGAKWILSDLMLYVAATGSDTTGDGTSGTPWATITRALSWLADKWIASTAIVTIQAGDGNYAISSAIEIAHPCGNRIRIVGQNTYARTMSSVQSSSGSAGAWSVVLNLNSAASISTGDCVLITAASGGTTPTYIMGCHVVTNVDSGNSRITVTSSHKAASAPSGAVSATVTVVKSRITCTGCSGLVCATPLLLVDKLVFVGDDTTNKAGIDTRNTNASGAPQAPSYGSVIVGASVGIAGFYFGVLAGAGTRITCMAGCCVSDSSLSGFTALEAAAVFAIGCVASGNLRGVYASSGGYVNAQSATLTGNTDGGRVAYHGTLTPSSAVITGNAYGLYAGNYGYSVGAPATMSGNTAADYSPSVNTAGNEGGYIDT